MNTEELIYSVVLGIVQGISEFLPISSSAHLIIVSWIFKGKALPALVEHCVALGNPYGRIGLF